MAIRQLTAEERARIYAPAGGEEEYQRQSREMALMNRYGSTAPLPDYAKPQPITAGPMQGGSRGVYGEFIPQGGAQGTLDRTIPLGYSSAGFGGGGMIPSSGFQSGNQWFGGVNDAPGLAAMGQLLATTPTPMGAKQAPAYQQPSVIPATTKPASKSLFGSTNRSEAPYWMRPKTKGFM